MKRILAVLLLLVAAAPAYGAESRYSVSVGESPSVGPSNAPVTLIEFLDYQ